MGNRWILHKWMGLFELRLSFRTQEICCLNSSVKTVRNHLHFRSRWNENNKWASTWYVVYCIFIEFNMKVRVDLAILLFQNVTGILLCLVWSMMDGMYLFLLYIYLQRIGRFWYDVTVTMWCVVYYYLWMGQELHNNQMCIHYHLYTIGQGVELI